MAFAAGTRLGPYAVTALVGVGGMGEVYKATDTRLARTVAIKTLSPLIASDPELRQAIRARSEGDLEPEPSAYLHALRYRLP